VKLKFLGAAGTVTGSAYLLTSDNTKVLIDFGMFQGTPEIDALNLRPLNFNPQEVQALFLTHAHLDHCGRIPLLVKNGFHGNIYATYQTIELAEVVLRDAAKIAEYNNPKNPLYTANDVEETMRLFKPVNYHEAFNFKNLNINYINAGHILGSASIQIKIEDKTISFSGDLGAFPDILVPNTEFFENSDFVVMESTYGGRQHPQTSAKDDIYKYFSQITNNSQTLLIPSFAIHKTQALLYLIAQMKKQNQISKNLKVYLDSPMALEVTSVYLAYKKDLLQSTFDFPGLTPVMSGSKSRRIEKIKEPKVIIAGSGMMNGGRILEHAKRLLNKGSTTLLFVGYQGEQTLGREIKEGAKQVMIDNKKVSVNAKVSWIESMSSHADEPRLIEWFSNIKEVKTLILTHGEDESRIKLASRIRKELSVPDVKLPQLDDEIEL
jgi:metallo-beta-lactamase family protein